MLFDVNPKEKTSDLYDRKRELEELHSSVKRGERLSVVYGVRRIGKTSLIHTFLSQKEVPYSFIDARQIYMESSSVPPQKLYQAIFENFFNFAMKFGGETEESLSKKYPTMFSGDEMPSLLRDINDWCKGKRISYVIVFDEAQYLRFGGSVKYDVMIAWSIDNLSNVTYMLTGSEIGMLKEFLKYEDVDAPLYGRFRNEIYLEKFDKETASKFLEKGFNETGKRVSKEEINGVIAMIGGIVGWLTYYGHYRCVDGLNHEKALKKVFDEGSKIVVKEIETLISKSRARYLSILRSISEGTDTWSGIKRRAVGDAGTIPDTRLNALLQQLVKFGIVDKTGDERYSIIDPITLSAVKKMGKVNKP
ncbi:MAG: AAA family ATPase [Candidatus Micrarchaeales archaeon]